MKKFISIKNFSPLYSIFNVEGVLILILSKMAKTGIEPVTLDYETDQLPLLHSTNNLFVLF